MDSDKMHVSDEDTAFRLVKLYFEEVARLGFKRKVDLDTTINAYIYTLDRLSRKKQEMALLDKVVIKEEQKLSESNKTELLKDFV